MNFNSLLSNSKKFINHNSATILTCVGAVGVIGTAILAAKATPKALKTLEAAKEEKGDDLTKLEVTVVAGPAYIPSIVVGATTIACIFGANILNKRQQAALTSAYAFINSSYNEYRNKVKELYGEEAEEEIQTAIAKDYYDGKEVIDAGGEELFYDAFSQRYFKSTKLNVQKAQYQLNRDLIMCDGVSVNMFYWYLGIPEIEGGDEIGWCTAYNYEAYWQMWIDFGFGTFTLDDGVECTKIEFYQDPITDFENYC